MHTCTHAITQVTTRGSNNLTFQILKVLHSNLYLDTVAEYMYMYNVIKVKVFTNDESYITVLIIETTGHHGRYSVINHS